MQGYVDSSRLPSISIRMAGPALAAFLFFFASQLNPSHAQIVRDGTIGPPSGPLIGPNYRIDSTLGIVKGSNLFHSFSEFNVRTLPGGVIESATFTNSLPATITNVLSRVTGGNPSEINGLLASEIPGANLFFMNPSGLVFGQNATLNVAGSVTFTTADYIRLFDGAVSAMFYANPAGDAVTTPGRASILSAAPLVDFGFVTPTAVGFLTFNPAPITVQGSALSVQPGQSLTMIGGHVDIRGALLDDGSTQASIMSAPGGQVKLASVATPGEMLLSNLQPASNIDGSFPTLGNIAVSEGTFIDVSDTQGGTIAIRGGQFVLDGSFLVASTNGDEPGASTAVKIHTDGNVMFSNSSFILSEAQAAGQPGDIDIIGQNVLFTEGSIAEARSLGSASAGNVSVNAEDGSVSLSGTNSFFGTGAAIRIDAGPCTECNGSSGNLSIKAKEVSLHDLAHLETLTFGNKRAGSLSLDVENLTVRGGSAVQTIGSNAPSGEISIIARGLVSLSGQFDSDNRSQIFSENNNPGGTGSIFLQAKQLDMSETARIRNFSFSEPVASEAPKITLNTVEDIRLSSGSEIIVENVLSNVGGIKMSGRDISLTGNSVVRNATSGSGDAGFLDITARGLTLSGMSQLSSGTSFGTGKGGNLGIKANTVSVTAGSTILAKSLGPGKAGNITIQGTASPAQSVTISGQGSGILTETSGTGTGGEITTWSNELQLTNSATISSKTTGQMAGAGDAGNILIKADDITISGGATITAASTGTGNAGTVTIQGTSSPAKSLVITGTGSGVFSNTSGTGAGGDILAISDSVLMTNGGTLSAATSGTSVSAVGGTIGILANDVRIENGGLLTAASTGKGDGGSIGVLAVRTIESRRGTVSTAASVAEAGDIVIIAGETVTLGSGTTVETRSKGLGNAGDIFIAAGRRFSMQDSSIVAEAQNATGGSIDILAVEPLILRNSLISTSVRGGFGNGGNIFIDPQLISLQNSSLLAQAVFGNGGNITLVTPLLLLDATSLISASSQFGQSGQIQAPTSNLAGTVSTLPSSLRQAQNLQTGRCAALANSQSSSFLIAGRETIPMEPGGWLPSPLAYAGTDSDPFAEISRSATSLLAMAEETVSLRRLTPAGFLTQSFAEGESTGCRA